MLLSNQGHRRWIMSMYARILEAALCDRSLSDAPGRQLTKPWPPFSNVASIWGRPLPRNAAPTGVLAALANQLAFDLALIDLAESVGLEVDAEFLRSASARPNRTSTGVDLTRYPLDELDQQANSM